MTENNCGATNREGEACGLPAGWGTDHNGTGRCKFHGGASLKGEQNGNYKHGAFSEHLRSDLTESELGAIDEMVEAYEDPEQALGLVREQAAEAYLKYKRSGDTRFLREYRQLVETFNLAPNSEQLELSGQVDGERTVDLDEDTKQAIRRGLAGLE